MTHQVKTPMGKCWNCGWFVVVREGILGQHPLREGLKPLRETCPASGKPYSPPKGWFPKMRG